MVECPTDSYALLCQPFLQRPVPWAPPQPPRGRGAGQPGREKGWPRGGFEMFRGVASRVAPSEGSSILLPNCMRCWRDGRRNRRGRRTRSRRSRRRPKSRRPRLREWRGAEFRPQVQRSGGCSKVRLIRVFACCFAGAGAVGRGGRGLKSPQKARGGGGGGGWGNLGGFDFQSSPRRCPPPRGA